MFALILVTFLSSAQCLIFDSILPGHTVCYDELGCFDSGPPFFSTHRLLSVVPQSPNYLQTKFLLYTRSSPAVADEEILSASDLSSITRSHFNGSRNTKLLVHGFTHNGHRQWIQTLKSELLKKDDVNVIVVDWQKGASLPYDQATANTRVIGAQIAQLIKLIMNVSMATPSSFHIIGHSLGAHVAGYAGERIQHLGRITGLDPANPYFQGTDASVRLDPTDADFVDVIHTDGTSITELGFGAAQPMGHVDFYPNGGKDQPGCDAGLLGKLGHTVWNAVSKLDYYAAEGAVACSHERSYYYFIESIKSSCPFTAYPCTSAEEFHKGNCLRCYGEGCSQMGYNADKFKARGSLFLETESASSYCDYSYQFNITASNSFDGKLTVTLTGTNGTAGPIHLMSSNEVHIRGTVTSKLLQTRVEIGDIQSVTLTYDKTDSLLLGWTYDDDWHLTEASVWSGEKQSKYILCANQKDAHNHQSVTLGLQGAC